MFSSIDLKNIVRQTTELGVDILQPIYTERTVSEYFWKRAQNPRLTRFWICKRYHLLYWVSFSISSKEKPNLNASAMVSTLFGVRVLS